LNDDEENEYEVWRPINSALPDTNVRDKN
jgi:hypothetical protein